jgi:DNA-binding protein Fis
VHLLRHALSGAGGNRTQAAKTLGLSLSTFRDKLRKHGVAEA